MERVCRGMKWLQQCVGVATIVAFASGCSDDDNGTGSVRFTTWGEQYIEEGLPKEAFLDAWSVKYSKFLVVYQHVTVADDEGNVVATTKHPLVFDMTRKAKGAPKTLASFRLEAKSWPNVSYQVGPMTDDAKASEWATDDDVELLKRENASVHVEGIATAPDGNRKTFSWSFSPATLFEGCHGEQGGKEVEGVLITNGGTEEVELTVHGDHMFYDDLQSEEGGPRFQAFADADSNGDGEVTLDEMDEVPLYTIPSEKGMYGTGALGNVNTLGQYVRTLARTIGHYRGEGSCNSKEVTP